MIGDMYEVHLIKTPAPNIKYRFEESIIETLESVAWWNWSAEKITANLEAIVGADIHALRTAGGL